MPLEYVQDDARRLVRMTMRDPVSLEERVAALERKFADGAWAYGLLIDARGLATAANPAFVRAFRSRVADLVAAYGPRGPIAIVAKASSTISAAQMFVILGRDPTETIEVFWDLDEALRWLDERMGNQTL